MSTNTKMVYGQEFLQYDFGDDHPFNPLRLELTMDLIETLELISPQQILKPVTAGQKELELFHSRAYVEAVQKAQAGIPDSHAGRYQLGTTDNPVFPGMHDAAATVVGSTLAALRQVVEGKCTHALNLAGGLHHAQRDQASGFCIYNDVAVAIKAIQKEEQLKILYLDTDAHHGDGVQWTFYYDPAVLTVSLHETGRYLFPGTGSLTEWGSAAGLGASVNLPLEPFTEDDSYLELFSQIAELVSARFKPDIIISQHGCDGHELDPLTHLSLTLNAYQEIPRIIHRLAHEYAAGRWLAVGGGGYDIWRVVPRAWTALWAEMNSRTVPEKVPESWLQKWRSKSPVTLPALMTDSAADYPPKARREERNQTNRALLERLKSSHPFFKES